MSARQLAAAGLAVTADGSQRSAREWLRFPGVTPERLLRGAAASAPADLLADFAEDARYAPYLERQDSEVAELRSNDGVALGRALDFGAVPGLSNEMVERLRAARPATLGQASRIRGITPAALSAILLHVRRAA